MYDKIFNNLNFFHNFKNLINNQLIIVKDYDNIKVIGNLSDNFNKNIKQLLIDEKYYEMYPDIYKLDIENKFYIFKKIGTLYKTIYFGIIADKTKQNRLFILDKQFEYLMEKCDDW